MMFATSKIVSRFSTKFNFFLPKKRLYSCDKSSLADSKLRGTVDGKLNKSQRGHNTCKTTIASSFLVSTTVTVLDLLKSAFGIKKNSNISERAKHKKQGNLLNSQVDKHELKFETNTKTQKPLNKEGKMNSQSEVLEASNKETFSDDYREVLPKNVVPSHYQIDITPGIEDGKGGHEFNGDVEIDLTVNESTDVIELNASSITVKEIQLVPYSGISEKVEVKEWKTDQEKELLTIVLSSKIIAKTKWRLCIKYTGKHDDNMAGFYRVEVVNGDKKEYMFSTQFESRHCCKAVPCWDEPELKATFGVTLRVPNNLVALSNMEPVTTELVNDVSSEGLKVVKYKTTPKMSTYLLAFVVGKLEFLENYTEVKTLSNGEKTSPIKCRVYATPNYVNKGKFSLEIGAKVLSFFEEYFDVPYPLSKMEQVAIADFSAGAMENWGLVTYRETALLFDEASSSSRFKLRVATTVAHEFAHQWFGNLVTMSWWNDLWLNEGFATFASVLVLNEIHPEWEPFVEFITDDLSSSLSLDGLATTHAIDVPIHQTSDIDQIFDSISYSKGASIINMVHSYLGYDNFRKSLQHYIKKHKYSNTKSDDIWIAFDEVNNKNLKQNMHNWIKKPGYPLLTVEDEVYDEKNKTITLTISQKRYYSSGITSGSDQDTVWWVPIVVKTFNGGKHKLISKELDSKKSTLVFEYEKTENSYWKLNAGSSGFYRVCLKDYQISNLSKVISNDINALSVTDKMGFISDTYAIAKSGEGNFTNLLNLLTSFRGESNYYVLSLITQVIKSLASVLYLRPESTINGIHALTKHILSDKVKEVGFDPVPGESTLDSLKRATIIGTLSFAGDEVVVSELKSRFEKFLAGDKSVLSSDIRDLTYSTILKYSANPREDLDTMINLYKNANMPDQFVVLLASLGSINSKELISELIDNCLLDKSFVRPQDAIYLFRSISNNSKHMEFANYALWKFTTDNWEVISSRYASSIHLLGSIFTSTIDSQVGNNVITQIKGWINGDDLKDTPNSEAAINKRVKSLKVIKRDIEQSIEALEIRTKWIERSASDIEKWLSKKGFVKSA